MYGDIRGRPPLVTLGRVALYLPSNSNLLAPCSNLRVPREMELGREIYAVAVDHHQARDVNALHPQQLLGAVRDKPGYGFRVVRIRVQRAPRRDVVALAT